MDAGEPLSDLQERWRGGRATGEAFKIFFALFDTDPNLASWNNSIKVAELIAKRFKVKGARTDMWGVKRRFLTVAHLWGACGSLLNSRKANSSALCFSCTLAAVPDMDRPRSL